MVKKTKSTTRKYTRLGIRQKRVEVSRYREVSVRI
jgi:hypothetical protein